MALSPALALMVSKAPEKYRLYDRWAQLEYKAERAGQAARKLELALSLACAEAKVAQVEAKLYDAQIRLANARDDAQVAESDCREIAGLDEDAA